MTSLRDKIIEERERNYATEGNGKTFHENYTQVFKEGYCFSIDAGFGEAMTRTYGTEANK